MAASAILAIKILADAKGAQKGMADASAATSKWATGVSRAASVAGVALAAGALKATKGASDLAETVSKTETVFGASAAGIKAWADGAAKAFGLSKQEALDAASGFQVMFTQLGIGAGTSETMSKGMIQAAADLASFHNVAGGTAEVTDMLSSAMRGEYDSLQRLIPNINAAAVQQEALKETHKKTAKELTDAEKAAATYQLVLKGMGPAAGDYAKTANGAANSQRTLQATMKDTSDTLGTALLPTLKSVLGIANKFADWAKENPRQLKLIIGSVLALVVAVKAINAALMTYRAILVVVQVVQAATFLTNPVFLIIAAIVLLVAAVVILWKRSETFRKIVTGAFKAVQAAAKAVWNWLKSNWPKLVAVLFGPFGVAVALIVKNWDKIKAAAAATWKAVKTATAATAHFFVAVWNAAFGAVKTALHAIVTAWNATFGAVKSAIVAVVNFFKAAWNAAFAVVRGYFNIWRTVVTGVFNGVRAAIGAVAAFLSSAFNRAVAFLTNVFNTLAAVVTAPFVVIQRAIETVIGWIDKLIEKIKGIHFPSFSLPDLNPFNASAPAPALSRSARGAPVAMAAGPTYVINIHGAIDPEGTARAIKRIVARHDRRVGVAR